MVSSQSLRSTNQISSITSKTANQQNQPPQPPLKKSAILSSTNANVVANLQPNSATSVTSATTRGNPPPIPPNKPIVPVKRDSNSRIPFVAPNTTQQNTTTNANSTATGTAIVSDVSQTPMFSSNITK